MASISRMAALSELAFVMSPGKSSAEKSLASFCADCERGFRTKQRTSQEESRNWPTTSVPTNPVAPVIRTFISTDRLQIAESIGSLTCGHACELFPHSLHDGSNGLSTEFKATTGSVE